MADKEPLATLLETCIVLREVSEYSLQAVIVKDQETDRILYINRRAADLVGLAPSEMINRPCSDFWDPDTNKIYRRDDAEIVANGPRLNYTETSVSRDGRRVCVLTNKWSRKVHGRTVIFLCAVDVLGLNDALTRDTADSFAQADLLRSRIEFEELNERFAKAAGS